MDSFINETAPFCILLIDNRTSLRKKRIVIKYFYCKTVDKIYMLMYIHSY